MRAAALLSIAGGLLWTAQINAAPAKTAKAACATAKVRVAAARHFPQSTIAFCDMVPAVNGPADYFVIALHSTRQCPGICSSNMGWFAVRKADGRVFEWNVAESRLGQRI